VLALSGEPAQWAEEAGPWSSEEGTVARADLLQEVGLGLLADYGGPGGGIASSDSAWFWSSEAGQTATAFGLSAGETDGPSSPQFSRFFRAVAGVPKGTLTSQGVSGMATEAVALAADPEKAVAEEPPDQGASVPARRGDVEAAASVREAALPREAGGSLHLWSDTVPAGGSAKGRPPEIVLPAPEGRPAAGISVAEAKVPLGSTGGGPAEPSVEVVAREMVNAVHLAWSQGGGYLRLRLKPDFLGQVELKVTSLFGRVSVAMAVESELVKSLVQAGYAIIRDNLAQYGMSLERLSVEVGNFGQGPPGEEEAAYQTRRRSPILAVGSGTQAAESGYVKLSLFDRLA
jgi:hypothetical protein